MSTRAQDGKRSDYTAEDVEEAFNIIRRSVVSGDFGILSTRVFTKLGLQLYSQAKLEIEFWGQVYASQVVPCLNQERRSFPTLQYIDATNVAMIVRGYLTDLQIRGSHGLRPIR